MLAIASSTYTRVEIDTLIANIPSSSGYTNTQIDTLLSDKQDNLSKNMTGRSENISVIIKQYNKTITI